IFVSQLVTRNNLSRLEVFTISCFFDEFHSENTIIFFNKFILMNQLILQEQGISRILNHNLLHHLTDNYLKVFIVNLNTLKSVYLLYLINQVLLNCTRAFDIQDIFRS